jgi:GR25 family glycosyltransferase involved in LPS biosynthesis
MVTWNDIKIADKGFLINLKRREDRLHDSLLEFEKLKINGVEIYEGIDYLDRPDLDYLCCSATHIEILKKQIENDWEKIIIFEDDFIFDPFNSYDFNFSLIIEKSISTINSENYDLLYLGTVLMDVSELKNDNIIVPSKTIQTTCYVIYKKFSKFVIENYDFRDSSSIMCNESIDTFYSILSSKKIKWKNPEWFVNSDKFLNNEFMIYCSNPIIFNQRQSYSDIQKKMANHFYSNKIRNSEFQPKKLKL